MIIPCKGLLMSSLQTDFCPNGSPRFLLTFPWEQFGAISQHTSHICAESHLQYLNQFHRSDVDATVSGLMSSYLYGPPSVSLKLCNFRYDRKYWVTGLLKGSLHYLQLITMNSLTGPFLKSCWSAAALEELLLIIKLYFYSKLIYCTFRKWIVNPQV